MQHRSAGVSVIATDGPDCGCESARRAVPNRVAVDRLCTRVLDLSAVNRYFQL